MSGHATPDELAIIRELELRLRQGDLSSAEMTKLGILYTCPMHDDDRAIEIFKKVLDKEPSSAWAIYWLADTYLDRDYLGNMEEIQEAKTMVEMWLDSPSGAASDPEARGAMYQMLVYTRGHSDINELSDNEWITFLEESVRLAPNWVNNRANLARAYAKTGRIKDAIEQLETAQRNMMPADTCNDVVMEIFESIVTGRISTSTASSITKMLEELRHS